MGMKPLKASNDIMKPEDIFELVNGCSRIVSSRKKDGNRMMIINGQILSSSFKEPRNTNIHEWLEPLCQRAAENEETYDMEVWDPDQTHHADTNGIINSIGHELPPNLRCSVFDGMPTAEWQEKCHTFPYSERIGWYTERISQLAREVPYFEALEQRPVTSPAEAAALFTQDVDSGEEGSMLRTTDIWREGNRVLGGWYKHDRATNLQCIIWKQKVYVTADGYIVGVQQRRTLRKDWPRTYTADGKLVRPLERDAYEPTDMIGSFLVCVPAEEEGKEPTYTEVGFRKGFDLDWRRTWWYEYLKNPACLLGQWVEFKHMPFGAKEGGKMRAGGLTNFRGDIPRMDVGTAVDIPLLVSRALIT